MSYRDNFNLNLTDVKDNFDACNIISDEENARYEYMCNFYIFSKIKAP